MWTVKKLSALAAAAAILAVPAAYAESDINVGNTANLAATARLDFRVVIPRFVFLQVGTGTVGSDVATIDQLTFSPTATELMDGTAVSAGAPLTVRVAGSGQISLNATAAGELQNNATTTVTMPWTQIGVTAAAPATPATGFTAASIAHPVLTAAGSGTAVTVGAAAATLVRSETTWAYSFLNSAAFAPGTYGGFGNTFNGRLTYTATLP